MRSVGCRICFLMQRAGVICCLLVLALPLLAKELAAADNLAAAEPSADRVTYDQHIKPILREKCLSCHNSDDRDGELDLSSYAATIEGGAAGAVVVSGDPLNSSLYTLVTHDDEPAMPPESPKIHEDAIASIKRWIEGGVLENSGSEAAKVESRGLPLELATTATDQPNSPPMPLRMSLEPTVHTARGDVLRSLAVNPWSSLAAVAGSKQVLLYDTTSLELLGSLPFQEGTPEVVRFSRSGALLLAGGGRGGASGKAVVWDVVSGERVVEVGDELDTVLAADISSDHALIALAGPKRVVRVYSTEDGSLKHELRKHVEWVYDAKFSPDAALLATADRSGAIVIWEAWSGQEYLSLKGHGPGKIDLAWRTDSNVLASCGADGAVRLWEMEKGKQVGMWAAHKPGCVSIDFTRDGRLVTCGKDRATTLWAADGKELRAFAKTKQPALRTAWCESSGRVLTGDFVGQVTVWDAASAKRVGQLTNNPPTLAKRLRSSHGKTEQAQIAAAEQRIRHRVLLAAVKDARAAVENVRGLEDAKRRADAARTMLMILEQRKQGLDKDIVRLEKRIAQIEKGLPTLQDAVRGADRSIRELGGDDEIRKVEQQLRTLARRRLGELRDKKRGLAAQMIVRRNIMPELERAKAALETALQAVKDIEAVVKPLRSALLEKQEAVALSVKTIEKHESGAVAADHAVKRWTREITFAKKLQTLDVRRQAAAGELAVFRQQHQELLAMHQRVTQGLARDQALLGERSRSSAAGAVDAVAVDSEEKDRAIAAKIAKQRDEATRLASEIQVTEQKLKQAQAVVRQVDEERQRIRQQDGE